MQYQFAEKDQNEREEILSVISPPVTRLVPENLVIPSAWATQSAEMRVWETEQGQILLCHGQPGVGKSTIAFHVAEEFQGKYREDHNVAVIDLSLGYWNAEPHTIENILCCILRQLCEKLTSLPEAIHHIVEHRRRLSGQLGPEIVSKAVEVVAAKYSRIFIFIDGLDECGTGMADVRVLLHHLFQFHQRTKANLFVMSLGIPEIMNRFKGWMLLEIRAGNDDVGRYLDGMGKSFNSNLLEENGNVLGDIKEQVVLASDGMSVFLGLHFTLCYH